MVVISLSEINSKLHDSPDWFGYCDNYACVFSMPSAHCGDKRDSGSKLCIHKEVRKMEVINIIALFNEGTQRREKGTSLEMPKDAAVQCVTFFCLAQTKKFSSEREMTRPVMRVNLDVDMKIGSVKNSDVNELSPVDRLIEKGHPCNLLGSYRLSGKKCSEIQRSFVVQELQQLVNVTLWRPAARSPRKTFLEWNWVIKFGKPTRQQFNKLTSSKQLMATNKLIQIYKILEGTSVSLRFMPTLWNRLSFNSHYKGARRSSKCLRESMLGKVFAEMRVFRLHFTETVQKKTICLFFAAKIRRCTIKHQLSRTTWKENTR